MELRIRKAIPPIKVSVMDCDTEVKLILSIESLSSYSEKLTSYIQQRLSLELKPFSLFLVYMENEERQPFQIPLSLHRRPSSPSAKLKKKNPTNQKKLTKVTTFHTIHTQIPVRHKSALIQRTKLILKPNTKISGFKFYFIIVKIT